MGSISARRAARECVGRAFEQIPALLEGLRTDGLLGFRFDVQTVNYRGTWFHVDDSDFRSKRVFTVLMLILNLVENIGQEQLPVITIPSG